MAERPPTPGTGRSRRRRSVRSRHSFGVDADAALLRGGATPGAGSAARSMAATPASVLSQRQPAFTPGMGIRTPGSLFSPSLLGDSGALPPSGTPGVGWSPPASAGATPAALGRASVHPATGAAAGKACVTVFGFPRGSAARVRGWFAARGRLLAHQEAGGQALHLRYDTAGDAATALACNGATHIVAGAIVGVIPCTDAAFLAGVGHVSALNASVARPAASHSTAAPAPSAPRHAGPVCCCCCCCHLSELVPTPGAYAPARRGGWLGWAARLLDVLCSM